MIIDPDELRVVIKCILINSPLLKNLLRGRDQLCLTTLRTEELSKMVSTE